MRSSDITIIGGGVMGLMTAREFLNAGASVTILEKNLCGQEASWAGGGILSPLYPWRQAQSITDLVLPSLERYPKIAADLHEKTGIDPEWTRSGLLVTQNPDDILAREWCRNSKLNVENPDAATFQNLNVRTENPIFLPAIAQIRNPRLLQALKQDVLNKGLYLIENCEITSFTLEHNRIYHLHSNRGKFPVNEIVLTTGAWTRSIFQTLLIGLLDMPEIYPAKGQMLLFGAPPDTLRHIILDGDRYLIPRRDGKIIVGSTVEHDVFHKTITVDAHNLLFEFATALLPALKTAPLLKHWAGLRPATDDGVPY
ncbi:MAG: FAD-dependent oxidoreductase, partial [Methylococcales bacterium]|nr:FAD-dependent oxidoreductase [Methylococcales bacterium]